MSQYLGLTLDAVTSVLPGLSTEYQLQSVTLCNGSVIRLCCCNPGHHVVGRVLVSLARGHWSAHACVTSLGSAAPRPW